MGVRISVFALCVLSLFLAFRALISIGTVQLSSPSIFCLGEANSYVCDSCESGNDAYEETPDTEVPDTVVPSGLVL
jgi:hypothetical protein